MVCSQGVGKSSVFLFPDLGLCGRDFRGGLGWTKVRDVEVLSSTPVVRQ